MKKIAIILLVWLVAGPVSLLAAGQQSEIKTTQVSSTTDVGVYGEFANFYLGKGNATAMVLACIGGNVSVPVDFDWPEMDGLIALRIAAGVGHRWWLYYHHDIYPEIPPMVTLIMAYDSSITNAVDKAKSLSEKIGDNLNVTFYPLWSWEERNMTIVLFTAELGLDETADFMRNIIISKFRNSGLSIFANSPVIDDNLANERYTRAALTIIQDLRDVDSDGNYEEYVPVLVLATVLRNSINEVGDGWYNISIRHALQLSAGQKIEADEISNISIIKISSFLPIEIDESRTNPLPDNAMYEYSGKLIYVIKAGDREKDPLDDIVVYMKPFNFTEELETMPLVTGGFYISSVDEGLPMWGFATVNITYSISLTNIGKGDAVNVTLIIPVIGALKSALDAMISNLTGMGFPVNYDNFTYGEGWNRRYVRLGDFYGEAYVMSVGNLGVNDTVEVNFGLILIPDILSGRGIAVISPPVGPLFGYEDLDGKRYFGFTNGFTVAPRVVSAIGFLVPEGRPEEVEGRNMTYRFNFRLPVYAFGTGNIKNVLVKLYVSKPEGMFSVSDTILKDADAKDIIEGGSHYNFSLSFEARLRSGVWLIYGTVEFDVRIGPETVHLGFVTNSYMVYVPPKPWVISKWIKKHVFPYPHVELDVSKVATYDNSTGELTIKVNITNIGDTNTTIRTCEFLLTDYVDIDSGYRGVLHFRINGEELDSGEYYVVINEELGVLIIMSPNISIGVNTTVNIEIVVKTDVNYTGEFVVRPTLIKYVFGEYTPDEIEKERDQADETGARMYGEHEGEETEHGMEGSKLRILMERSMVVFQEGGDTTPLSTFTNAVVLSVAPPSGKKVHWGFIILLTIVISIIVVAYIVVSKRKS